MKELITVFVPSRAELRRWLLEHHTQEESIWLVFHKKSSGLPTLSYDDIVEEVLCFGWIDSLPGKVDETRTKLRLSPRKPGSGWSRINKQRIEKLMSAGLMHPSGLLVIEKARKDGSWDLLNEVDELKVPEDLVEAFTTHAGSAEKFAAFAPSSKRGILEWIQQAKTPETRLRRVSETARLASLGLKANFPESKGK